MKEKPLKDKSQKGNILKIVIIVLLLLIVVGGAAFGGMYIAGKKTPSTGTATAKVEDITEISYSLDEFLVNLLDDDGRRYLKVKVFIGYEEKKGFTEELELKKHVIRELITTSFRSKKTTDFTALGVDTIKSEIIASINPILSKGQISHIYFNDILVQ